MQSLQLDHITKKFPGVTALDDIVVSFLPGEIHAVAGENGAGKSTMMNVLTGNLQPDSGEILLNGNKLIIKNPRDAFEYGIAIVHQHLSLVDSLSIAENIYANRQPHNRFGIIRFGELYKKTAVLLHELGLDELDPATPVTKLSAANRQMVEIAKALAQNPSILILDEPTASLTEKETAILFTILLRLRKQGTAIIYISHRMDEIFRLSDRVTILKDGKYQGTFATKDITKDELIRRMVGREIQALKSQSTTSTEIMLDVKNISGPRFKNISFQVYRGEIVGLAGLIGAGRTEIARAIFGADRPQSGEIVLRNKKLDAHHPREAIANGIAYVPEERKSLGLFPDMSVADNIVSADLTLAAGGKFYNQSKARQTALRSRDQLGITSTGVEKKVTNLSGGNQQKVVLARWLLTRPDVLIVDEPTHGIDVGAKYEIYGILKDLAKEGKSILMISSDLPELIGLCDRILVIRKGIVAGEIARPDFSEEKIMSLAAN